MGDELSKKDSRRIAEEKQIKFIRLRLADVLGFHKSFAVIRSGLEKGL